MKFSVKAIFTTMLLAVVALACESDEQFVTKEAGVWKVVSHASKIVENGVLVTDQTLTDNLGEMEFRMTGQGFRISSTAVRDTFIWQLNGENDHLIIYNNVGPWWNTAISNRTDNEMTLSWENEASELNKLIKTEQVLKIQRAQ